jgi:hypothetical protein
VVQPLRSTGESVSVELHMPTSSRRSLAATQRIRTQPARRERLPSWSAVPTPAHMLKSFRHVAHAPVYA